MNCHCGKKLKRKLGRNNVFFCSCGCIYRLVITKKSEECSRKELEKKGEGEVKTRKRKS